MAPDGTQCQPGPWQAPAIPGQHRPVVGQHQRLAGQRHPARFDLGQIGRQQLQPVRVVAEQVALDEDVGDIAGPVRGHASGLQQQLRKVLESGSIETDDGLSSGHDEGALLQARLYSWSGWSRHA